MIWKSVGLYKYSEYFTNHFYAQLNPCGNIMSIVIFLILLTSSMSYGDAAENSNKEEIVYRPLETSPEIPVFRKKRQIPGQIEEQDPSDPKYQAMAEDLVYQHLHIKKQDTRKIIVTKVTTQPVEGLITTIRFQVVLKTGETLTCSSRIWEQPWKHFKDISYQCSSSNYNNNNPSGIQKLSMPLGQNNPSVIDHTMYLRLATESIVNYLKNLPEHNKVPNSDIHFKSVVRRQRRVDLESVLYINVEVKVSPSRNFKCTAVFEIPSGLAALSVECLEQKSGAGVEEWQDPSQEKYLRLAQKSFLNNNNDHVDLDDIIVTFVVDQVVSGSRDTIDFFVSHDYKCRSIIWEKFTEENVLLEVSCDKLSAGQSRGTGRKRWTRT